MASVAAENGRKIRRFSVHLMLLDASPFLLYACNIDLNNFRDVTLAEAG
jgi:hypothetical protein